MDRLTQFFASFRTLTFVGALAATILPWPGITCSAVAGQIPVGGETSLRGPYPYWSAKPAFHTLADVNGDGFADLIYTLTTSDPNAPQTNVYVQYSNGTSFGAPVVVATDSSASVYMEWNDGYNFGGIPQALVLAVGDVNGDGQKDLLFANGSVSTVLRPSSLIPTYLIGSVSYVPPGGSGTGSKITYSVGALTGSTITTKNSWTASSTISGGVSIFGDSETLSFGLASSGSDSTSVNMLQTMTLTVPYSQLPSDVINHDYDVIQLYFGVVVNGTRDYTGDVTLSLDFSKMLAEEFSVDGYNVPVGCFRPGSSIYLLQFCSDWQNLFLDTAPDRANKFQLTLDDFPNIVGADPYADPATTPSTPNAVPGRYVLLTNFPYQPTFSLDNPATWAVTNSSTTTNTHTSTVTYTVGLKDVLKSDPTGLLFGELTIDNKFTWTHESDSSKIWELHT